MDRIVMSELREWYESDDGRILFLCGAPKVGKSWLIEELCRQTECRYDEVSVGQSLQSKGVRGDAEVLVIRDICNNIAMMRAKRLIMRMRLDEWTSRIKVVMEVGIIDKTWFLQHFVDEDYIRMVRVYPMNFMEYKSIMSKRYNCEDGELIRMYLLTGGLPGCVKYFFENGDFNGVRNIQRMVLQEICMREESRDREILESVPMQLMSSNIGFRYRQINKNARKRQYGQVLEYLEKKGVLYKISQYSEDNDSSENHFKLYLYDVGLLTLLGDMEVKNVLNINKAGEVQNGWLIKSFVVQEISSIRLQDICRVCYWIKHRAKARLPFIIHMPEENITIPMAVYDGKSYEKSIEAFAKLHKISKIYRINGVSPNMNNRTQCAHDIGDVDIALGNMYMLYEDVKRIIKCHHTE